MNMYVGNLSYEMSEENLRNEFAEYGEVKSAKIITDRDTGRSRGFGFVEMNSDGEGKKAMEALTGKDFEGRELIVNEARPREERSRR